MAGYRDDRGAAMQRVAELEEEVAALRKSRRDASWRAYAVLALSGGAALVGFGALHRSLPAALIGVLLVALVGGVHTATRRRKVSAEPTGSSRPALLPGAQPVSAEALAGTGTFTLPARFVVPEGFERLAFEARVSQLVVYDDSAFFTLAAAITNRGEDELASLDVALQLLDSSAEPRPPGFDADSVLDEFGDPPLRSGDVHVFDRLLVVEDLSALRAASLGVVEARIAIVSATLAPLQQHGAAEIIDVAMAEPPPAHARLAFRERRRVRQDGGETLDLEVENVGGAEVSELTMTVRYHLDDGSHRDDDILHQLTYRARPIPPGETRLARLRATLGQDVVRWQPVVVRLG